MKKWYWLIVAVVIFCFLLISCKSDPYQSEESKEFISELESQISYFNDKLSLAGTTSRISLTPVISDMQDIKREVINLEVPENTPKLAAVQELCINGMENAIDGYQMFQLEEEGESIFEKLDNADRTIASVLNTLNTIKNSKE